MAKSISADKRENEKKRLARRAEKQKKKEEKKLSNKANSFEDMIAYVDKNGMITSAQARRKYAVENSVKKSCDKMGNHFATAPL